MTDSYSQNNEELSSIPRQRDDRLRLFNKLVQKGFEASQKENMNYHKFTNYVYDSALTDEDKKSLQLDGRSTLNYPILKPYMQRSLKNVVDSMPTLDVVPTEEDGMDKNVNLPTTTVADILDTTLREIVNANRWQNVVFNVSQSRSLQGLQHSSM